MKSITGLVVRYIRTNDGKFIETPIDDLQARVIRFDVTTRENYNRV